MMFDILMGVSDIEEFWDDLCEDKKSIGYKKVKLSNLPD